MRMTETIDYQRRSAAEPTHYYDKDGREISRSQWEFLRGDAGYQQCRITNVTGLRPTGGYVFIRVHTIWTGTGEACGFPCCGARLFETRVFDYFDYLPGLEDWRYDLTNPWPWRDAAEADKGHTAIVREILPRVMLGEAHDAENLTPTLDLKRLYEQRISMPRFTYAHAYPSGTPS